MNARRCTYHSSRDRAHHCPPHSACPLVTGDKRIEENGVSGEGNGQRGEEVNERRREENRVRPNMGAIEWEETDDGVKRGEGEDRERMVIRKIDVITEMSSTA
jgi:hypothetical protein